jgi:PAS domain-containing protein
MLVRNRSLGRLYNVAPVEPDNKPIYSSLLFQNQINVNKDGTFIKKSVEAVMQTRKGSPIPVDVTYYKRIVEEVPYVIVRMVDVTERKRIELELLKVEAKFDSILRTAVDAIIVINSVGIIEEFNPAAERLTGFSSNEVRGQNVSMLMTSRYAHGKNPRLATVSFFKICFKAHDSYLKNYLRTGVRKIIGIGREVTCKKKDGSVFPIDLAVSAMSIGEEIKFTGIIRDVSERKKMERLMIEQANQIALTAQISSRTKSEFLGLMSHGEMVENI